jgi:outer membrane PBP1 activator LpoA protein
MKWNQVVAVERKCGVKFGRRLEVWMRFRFLVLSVVITGCWSQLPSNDVGKMKQVAVAESQAFVQECVLKIRQDNQTLFEKQIQSSKFLTEEAAQASMDYYHQELQDACIQNLSDQASDEPLAMQICQGRAGASRALFCHIKKI